jgi:hypothetical protein
MEVQNSHPPGRVAESWLGIVLCAAVVVAAAIEPSWRDGWSHAGASAVNALPIVAAALATTALIGLHARPRWPRLQRTLHWSGLLLLVWAANGLPFDLLRLTPLIPLPVDWPGMATRATAFAAAGVLAHLALTGPAAPDAAPPARWYGYAAFVLAMPYPFLRTVWALGGTIGLTKPDAAGHGFLPWLACLPWLMAAALSLLLITPSRRKPRRLLLSAGWLAAALVNSVGPGACWVLLRKFASGRGLDDLGLAVWVPCLFYGSWLLWGIVAAAATRSYQLRSASGPGSVAGPSTGA